MNTHKIILGDCIDGMKSNSLYAARDTEKCDE